MGGAGLVALVTGASGLLGQHVLRELQKRPSQFREIRVLDRQPFQKFLDFSDQIPTIEFTGDCANEAVVDNAIKGVDVVFHVAGKMYTMDVYISYDRDLYWHDNFRATEQILRCMRKHNVPWLVYTSDVGVCWGDVSCINTKEDEMLYPPSNAYYLGGAFAKSKIAAEALVRQSNDTALRSGDRMKTLTIRPTLMYGEGDNFLVKHALSLCKKHGILHKVGHGVSRVELAYAGNIAHMHALAFEKLTERPTKLSGQVFNATEFGRPQHYFDLIERFVNAAGYKTSPYYLPLCFIYPLTFFVECLLLLIAYLTGRKLDAGMPNTRMVRKSSHYVFTYSTSKAKRLLGFAPIYDPDKSMEDTIRWWKLHWRERVR